MEVSRTFSHHPILGGIPWSWFSMLEIASTLAVESNLFTVANYATHASDF